MNVIVIKTLGGEELLAELDNVTDDALVVSRPRVFHLIQQGASLIPYFFSEPDKMKVPLAKSGIIAWFDASSELSRHYLEAVSQITLHS